MGLKDEAAQLAQANVRKARETKAQTRQRLITDTEDQLTYGTGVTATYLRNVEVAYVEFLRGNVTFGTRSSEVLATKTGMLFSLDDVELLVTNNERATDGHKITLALHDANYTPSYYMPEYHQFWLPERPDRRPSPNAAAEPDPEQRRQKFVKDLANTLQTSGNLKHPALRLAEEGKTCPTCGRGF